MNRYELDGVARDITNGKRVVVCASHNYSNIIFKEVEKLLEDRGLTPTRVLRANGRQRIECGEGALRFAHSYDALRGVEADKVLISVSVRESPSFLEQWLPNARLVTNNGAIEQISG